MFKVLTTEQEQAYKSKGGRKGAGKAGKLRKMLKEAMVKQKGQKINIVTKDLGWPYFSRTSFNIIADELKLKVVGCKTDGIKQHRLTQIGIQL